MTEITRPSITAIVIAKNEAEMIANCLATLQWCDEIIVVDNGSEDATAGLAKQAGARVVESNGTFAELRNRGLSAAKTDWVLYIDADERVSPPLAIEIQGVIVNATHAAYQVHRENVVYGQSVQHGGWEKDWIVRLFERRAIKTWSGEVHEHAEINGSTGQLSQTLLHLTHRSVMDGLRKTVDWIPIEARLLHEAGTPPVTGVTLLRKFGMELLRRLIITGGYRDGMPGVVEAWVQAMNRLLVYIELWQLQQKPSLPERYQEQEAQMHHRWRRAAQ